MMEQVRGIVLPSPTVFLEDGRVDEKLMRELTDWFIDCGVHAFFVLGSYGQGPAMASDERKKVAEIVVQQVKHRVPVVVQACLPRSMAVNGSTAPIVHRRRRHRPCGALLLRRPFGV
jgi:dihydrodipicolinate synthase/N-acetylneuraminate lyase